LLNRKRRAFNAARADEPFSSHLSLCPSKPSQFKQRGRTKAARPSHREAQPKTRNEHTSEERTRGRREGAGERKRERERVRMKVERNERDNVVTKQKNEDVKKGERARIKKRSNHAKAKTNRKRTRKRFEPTTKRKKEKKNLPFLSIY